MLLAANAYNLLLGAIVSFTPSARGLVRSIQSKRLRGLESAHPQLREASTGAAESAHQLASIPFKCTAARLMTTL